MRKFSDLHQVNEDNKSDIQKAEVLIQAGSYERARELLNGLDGSKLSLKDSAYVAKLRLSLKNK